MPLNLLKKYNELLDLIYNSERELLESLRRVFDSHITNNPGLSFRGKGIFPTKAEGENELDRLFRHLTTKETDKQTKKREFDSERSARLHWIKHHIEELKKQNVLVFSLEDEKRTYILDKDEKYVIILEPWRKQPGYYLITAYKLESASYRNILRKYERDGKDGPL